MMVAPTRTININGKAAKMYDDVFTFTERKDFYYFAMQSLYKMTGHDGIATEADSLHYQIYSHYCKEDVDAMGFFAHEAVKQIMDDNGCNPDNCKQFRVNCSHMGEKNVTHSDGKGKTLLCNLNITWKPQWGGHLMLMDEEVSEPLEIIGYVPGRITIIDGDIPHCVMTPTIMSPFHRYNLVVQFNGVY